MPELTRPIASEIAGRLEKLSPNTKPLWGNLTAPELIQHLIGTFKQSTGEITDLPFVGNWAFEYVVGPLALAGFLPIPKNLKIKANGKSFPAVNRPGDLNDLRGCMEAYIAGVENGTMKTSYHPYFGDIGSKGWSKMHVKHMRHHLKQFGL